MQYLLQLPITSGDPKATSNISLGVNLPATAEVVTSRPEFTSGGYNFNPNDPNTFTNSTSITIFDDLGNPTIATMYFVKTQAASTSDPTNKFETKLVIGDTIIDPDLVSAVDDTGQQILLISLVLKQHQFQTITTLLKEKDQLYTN